MTLKLADGSIVLSNGRVVPPGGALDSPIKQPRSTTTVQGIVEREAQSLVIAANKKLVDLPDVPKTMNTIAVVLAYTLFGLDAGEIATATKLTNAQVAKIMLTDAYTSMHETVVQSIINAESGDIRDTFVKHARSAASTIVNVMESGKTADRMAAAKDILDRGGFRPNDVVEHRHQLEGGLTIEIVRKDENRTPTIELTAEDYDA